MQFTRNTSGSKFRGLFRLLIKVVLVIITLFIGVILIGKIDFPTPNKKIEKVISNEKFKKIK
tara:strand:+ start:1023 stop:1208 length:186 start_codon:yes stop_codon:yes gene_type:complete